MITNLGTPSRDPNPVIAEGLVGESGRFLLDSACSWLGPGASGCTNSGRTLLQGRPLHMLPAEGGRSRPRLTWCSMPGAPSRRLVSSLALAVSLDLLLHPFFPPPGFPLPSLLVRPRSCSTPLALARPPSTSAPSLSHHPSLSHLQPPTSLPSPWPSPLHPRPSLLAPGHSHCLSANRLVISPMHRASSSIASPLALDRC